MINIALNPTKLLSRLLLNQFVCILLNSKQLFRLFIRPVEAFAISFDYIRFINQFDSLFWLFCQDAYYTDIDFFHPFNGENLWIVGLLV